MSSHDYRLPCPHTDDAGNRISCSEFEARARPATYECGDCGDNLRIDPARPGRPQEFVHADDGTPVCTSRTQANARRTRQGHPIVGEV